MSKILCIGDLHFGEKGNSEAFNNHILDFIDWAIDVGKEHGVDLVVQFGDWFHQRHMIQVQTLNYGIVGAQMLGVAFGRDNVYVLEGNHDLFYLERLDISSVSALNPFVTVVSELTSVGEILMTPWVTDAEMWDEVVAGSLTHSYLFAHLELNGFKVNDGYAMEHGHSHKALKRYKQVITGHYHSKQEKDNVLYVGTPYPITMNEANEPHGVYIFDSETGDKTFVEYERLKVLSVPYDQAADVLKGMSPEYVSIRLEFPDDLEDETLVESTKQSIVDLGFSDVKVKYKTKAVKELIDSDVDVESSGNIDDLVIKSIKNSPEIRSIKKNLLETLYLAAKGRATDV